MAGNFHEQFASDDVSLPSERSTGLVFAAVALIVAAIWYNNVTVLSIALPIAAGFAIVSFLSPKTLRPLNIAWFKLSLLLNKIVSPVVMFVLFAIIIVPAGVVMQLLRDPLRKRRPMDESTCWIDRSNEQPTSTMKNQF